MFFDVEADKDSKRVQIRIKGHPLVELTRREAIWLDARLRVCINRLKDCGCDGSKTEDPQD